MEALAAGPRLTENGTFLSTGELLDGKQPGALMALVINGTMDKQAEMASRLRTHSMNALGTGLRMDIAI